MNTVHIVPDEKDPTTWTTKQVDHVLDYLLEEFKGFPKNARIYHGGYAVANDVTPAPTFADIERFKQLEGTFYVVIKPSLTPFEIIAIVSAVVSLVATGAMLLMMPKAQKQQQESPNNELNARQNIARIKGRIPDILGTVRAYPDLICEPYTTYHPVTGVEIERALYAICRNKVHIHDMKDATTDIEDIPDTSVSVYYPNTSIVGTPYYQTGRNFNDLPLSVTKSKSITGQVLDSPNQSVIESNAIHFEAGGVIKTTNPRINFTTSFGEGDGVVVIGATFGVANFSISSNLLLTTNKTVVFETPQDIADLNFEGLSLTGALVAYSEINQQQVGGVNTDDLPTSVNDTVVYYRDFSGQYDVSNIAKSTTPDGYRYEVALRNANTINPSWNLLTNDTTVGAGLTLNQNPSTIYLDDSYSIASVTNNTINLRNASSVNTDWDKLLTLPSQSTQGVAGITIVLDRVESKWVGWHVLNRENASKLIFNIYFPQGLWRQNSKGGVSDDWTSAAIEWQHLDRDGMPIGEVNRINKSYAGETKKAFGKTEIVDLLHGGSVRFRICRTRVSIANNVNAEMRIKDVYLAEPTNISNYGNITVIQSEALGNDGTYSIKERKLNCLVTSIVREDGVGPEIITSQADQLLIHCALDPFIGRRSIDEVDIAQIKSEIEAVRNYFGSNLATEFCYTLDDPKLSFEETASMIASAVFCEATRFGNQLRLYFERPQTTARLLFNHRNKVPRSEKRTYTTSIDNEYDGVEIEYTDPKDDARITYTAPENTTVTNPLKIESTGIRNAAQAKTRAWREWNRMRYRRVDIEFEALDEANILVRNNMIMVADNTREKTQDGQVIKAEGLKLTLSQDVDFSGQASIYLQMSNGTIDVIGCQLGEYSNEVILNRTPLYPVVTESDRYVKTVYQVVKASEKTQMFLLASADPVTQMTQKLTAYNYDARYYSADHNFF